MTTFFTLAALKKNGSLDDSFGKTGKQFSAFPDELGQLPGKIAIDAEKRLIFASTAVDSTTQRQTLFLARYLPNGHLDTTFGIKGFRKESVYPGSADTLSVQAIAVDHNNNIITAGYFVSGGITYPFLVKHHENGSPDGDFCHTLEEFHYEMPRAGYHDLALCSNGKIIVTGWQFSKDGVNWCLIKRFSPQGELDIALPGFNSLIQAVPSVTCNCYGTAIWVDSQQRVLVGIHAVETDGQHHSVLQRYRDSGDPDYSFKADPSSPWGGSVSLPMDYDSHTIKRLRIDAQGRILVGMELQDSGKTCASVLRLLKSGELDDSFNSHTAFTEPWPIEDFRDMQLTPNDGVTVGAQWFSKAKGNCFALRRYRADGKVDANFGDDGVAIIDVPYGLFWLVGWRLVWVKSKAYLDALYQDGERTIALGRAAKFRWILASGLSAIPFLNQQRPEDTGTSVYRPT
jgi:uncharacterized delta-60 repeat protein